MKKRGLVLIVFVLGVFLGAGILGLAQSNSITISAFINRDIKMTWDGSAFEARESDGRVLSPIIYEGRTYLPAKYIADKAGINVNWNEATKTVEFSSRRGDIPYLDSSGGSSSQTSTNEIPFRKFDLEIDDDDDDDKELDIEYEVHSSGNITAKVERKNHRTLYGQDAINYLQPILKNLNISSSMSRQEIMDKVMSSFSWTGPYEEFDIEVRFFDGSTIKFEIDK